jgi:hypothetical protein
MICQVFSGKRISAIPGQKGALFQCQKGQEKSFTGPNDESKLTH